MNQAKVAGRSGRNLNFNGTEMKNLLRELISTCFERDSDGEKNGRGLFLHSARDNQATIWASLVEKINSNRFAIHQILVRNIEKINNPSSLIQCARRRAYVLMGKIIVHSALKFTGIINYFYVAGAQRKPEEGQSRSQTLVFNDEETLLCRFVQRD